METPVGHKTFREPGGGFRHEPIYADEAARLMASVEAATKRRNELMPDEQSAIEMFFDAWLRLADFGWKDAIYCPKDGAEFLVIEPGSTGKHRCIYRGEWPKGSWWVCEDGDEVPSRPALYREVSASETVSEVPK